jgi:hypothetical protein
MKNITKRDVKYFLLGMLAMFLIELALNWQDAVDGFNDGYRSVRASNASK